MRSDMNGVKSDEANEDLLLSEFEVRHCRLGLWRRYMCTRHSGS